MNQVLEKIVERLDRIEERIDCQNIILSALQHRSEVAGAESDAISLALARSGEQMAEIARMSGDILKRVELLAAGQEIIRESLRDQAMDINLLKKIVSI
ncbi:MAG: hypothetical protein ACOY31_06535 [Bacillota bacterium]